MRVGDTVFIMVDGHSCNAIKEKVAMLIPTKDAITKVPYNNIWLSNGQQFNGRTMQAINQNKQHYIFKKQNI